jgi:hypothetical protein
MDGSSVGVIEATLDDNGTFESFLPQRWWNVESEEEERKTPRDTQCTTRPT